MRKVWRSRPGCMECRRRPAGEASRAAGCSAGRRPAAHNAGETPAVLRLLRYSVLLVLMIFAISAFADDVEVYHETKRDRSQQLKSIPPKPPRAGVKMVVPNVSLPEKQPTDRPVTEELDTVAQLTTGVLAMPATTQNFEGMSAQGAIPPDTNGEAGRNHYVQMVNKQFAVFDKAGNIVFGPVDTNTLWTGFGGICETLNQGDPIVVYDQLANRWLISQFANQPGGAHLECVAISTTEDPTGSYYRYAFSFPVFNDYPKIGVWADGYYSTYILRNPDFSIVSGRICAFDRSKMLSGLPASAQCFNVGATNTGLLPADLDGITPPPAGSPHFSMNVSATSLNLWRVKINWTSPGSSTVTGPISIPVAAYTRACNSASGLSCVPQPGVTQKLHAFSDRLMFRLSYRNFGSHQAMVVNHSVQAGSGVSAIRWYEVRSPQASPFIFQQGTYSPDTTHRWMGSAAADLNGNMAIGYSVSSSLLFPGIRYAGRLVTDLKGTLAQGESIIIAGTGSQSGSNRWGDYSDLTVDPVDDCTFWYTTEYMASTGSFNWRTRIASFKFPSCGCALPAGISNNTAADVSQTAFSGVAVTWLKDPGNWGDNATGTRSYDVLRNGTVLTSPAYGTTSFVDTTAAQGQNYSYSVRYKNGCSLQTATTGAAAGDFLCATPSQLLMNPGFESGRTLWSSSASGNINNSNATYKPFQGSWKVTLNGKGVQNTGYVYQQVTIPANACSATLSFWSRVVTSETTTTSQRDTLSVEILNSSGAVLKTLAKYSNLNKTSTYTQKIFSLIAYKGQTIRIRFRGVEDQARKTAFLIDETALNIVQ